MFHTTTMVVFLSLIGVQLIGLTKWAAFWKYLRGIGVRAIPKLHGRGPISSCVLAGLLVGTSPAISQPAANAADIYQKKLDEVYALAYRVAPDTPDIGDRETPEAAAKRFEEIRTRPGITPYLFAILDRVYFGSPQDGFESILYAISLRRDLTSGQVAVLTDEMKKRLASPPARKYWWYDDFLAYTAPVLAAYPSPEHEELAMQMLQRPVDDVGFIKLRINPAKALADMGSVKALPLIRETVERIRKKYGDRSGWLDQLEAAQATLDSLQKKAAP